jgi:hypothetical protein
MILFYMDHNNLFGVVVVVHGHNPECQLGNPIAVNPDVTVRVIIELDDNGGPTTITVPLAVGGTITIEVRYSGTEVANYIGFGFVTNTELVPNIAVIGIGIGISNVESCIEI